MNILLGMEVMGTWLNSNGVIDLYLGIAICVIFSIAVPVINMFSANFKKPHADTLTGEEILLDEKNGTALARATLKDNKVCLKKANGVKNVTLDVFFFNANKSKKVQYVIGFEGDYAVINPGFAFDNVKIVVLNCDGKLVNKKVYGYPNPIFTILASISLGLGIFGGIAFPAFSYSKTFDNAYQLGHSVFVPEYGVTFYLTPLIVGVIAGVLHFFLVKLITNSFNKGAK